MKTLHLVLKHKWYDMIDLGEKKEEYRDATPYWGKRLRRWSLDFCEVGAIPVVMFYFGYGRNRPKMAFLQDGFMPLFAIKGESFHPEWGEPDTPHYVIRLGERVVLK